MNYKHIFNRVIEILLVMFLITACGGAPPASLAPAGVPTKPLKLTLTPTTQSTMASAKVTTPNAIPSLTLVGVLGYGYPIAVAWSPDGSALAVGTSAGVVQYDTQNWLQSPNWHNSNIGSVNSLSYSPNDRLLAMAGWEGLAVWNVVSGQEQILQANTDAYGVAFSPDGKLLATGSYAEDVKIWDVVTGDIVLQLKNGDRGILEVVAFSPDGKLLATASANWISGHSDGIIRLWDVSSGKQLLQVGDSNDNLAGVAFSPDGKAIASNGDDNSVRLYDTATGSLISKLEGNSGDAVSVSFSPDGRLLASSAGWVDSQVRIWDIPSSQLVTTLNGCSHQEYSMSSSMEQGTFIFNPDGRRLTSACEYTGVMVWDLVTNQLHQITQGYIHNVSGLAISSDGSLLATGDDISRPGNIHLWNLKTRIELTPLRDRLEEVLAIAFSPAGTQLASGGFDGVRLWDLKTGVSTLITAGHPSTEVRTYNMIDHNLEPINSLAFSPDGSNLAVSSGGGWVIPGWLELYDTDTGEQIASFENIPQPYDSMVIPYNLAFSPDGTILASGDADGKVRLWDSVNERVIRILSSSGFLNGLAFSPNGEQLATGTQNGDIILWGVRTGVRLDQFHVGEEAVHTISFSPDGELMAVGLLKNEYKQCIVLINLKAGEPLGQANCGGWPYIAFSPDGTILAVGDKDGTIRLWGVPSH